MTTITTSLAIVIVLLAATLILAAIGRVQTTPGMQRGLTGVLVLTVIALVALQALTQRAAPRGEPSADSLQRFIASLPAEARGADAEQTRERIQRLIEVDAGAFQSDCETLVGQNAEFARALERLRTDIQRATDTAAAQQATIDELREENRRLQAELETP